MSLAGEQKSPWEEEELAPAPTWDTESPGPTSSLKGLLPLGCTSIFFLSPLKAMLSSNMSERSREVLGLTPRGELRVALNSQFLATVQRVVTEYPAGRSTWAGGQLQPDNSWCQRQICKKLYTLPAWCCQLQQQRTKTAIHVSDWLLLPASGDWCWVLVYTLSLATVSCTCSLLAQANLTGCLL